MRIAQVAPLVERVPPQGYGGTERVVSWLTEELVRRGHHVTLFASGDSKTAAELVAPCRRALRLDPSRARALAWHVIELDQAFQRARDGAFDLVHGHVDYLAFPFGHLLDTPVLHTLHGRLDQRDTLRVLAQFRDVPLVSISDSQRRPARALGLRWVATVHHGLPVEEIPFQPAGGRGGYLAFLGRMSREKRPDLAIAVATRLGLPLRIAAKIDKADQQYFEREIQPLLANPLVDFVGEVNDGDKWSFLGDALCLLFPIDWPEPFGVAMIEALACGTPVVTRPVGAASEVIRGGEVGFLADTVDELVTAVKRIDVIERARCRSHVEEAFSVRAMVDRYEAVYRTLVS